MVALQPPEGGREERKDEGIPPMSQTVQQHQGLMKGRELQDHLPSAPLKTESRFDPEMKQVARKLLGAEVPWPHLGTEKLVAADVHTRCTRQGSPRAHLLVLQGPLPVKP